MKNLAKSLLLSFAAAMTFFTVAMGSPVNDSKPKARVELQFLRGDVVAPGGMITAEIAAKDYTELDLTIENADGYLYGEKHIVIDHGAKLIRFKIADVPAGTYYIKLANSTSEQAYEFHVK